MPPESAVSTFQWTGRREEAARLVALDSDSDESIAASLGINRKSLARWKRHPQFQARVQAIRDAIREQTVTTGIADKVTRVKALNARWLAMQQVIEARARTTPITVPGGDTGLLTKTIRVVGRGKDQYEVEEWAVDTALLREIRGHEEQAAKELAQWVERRELTGKDGGPIQTQFTPPDLSGLSDDDLATLDAILSRAVAGDRADGASAPSSA